MNMKLLIWLLAEILLTACNIWFKTLVGLTVMLYSMRNFPDTYANNPMNLYFTVVCFCVYVASSFNVERIQRLGRRIKASNYWEG